MNHQGHEPLAVSRRSHRPSAQERVVDQLVDLPWWAILILLAGVILLYRISHDVQYSEIFQVLLRGLPVTLTVTVVGFGLAILFGLLAGLGRTSGNPIIYNLATLYVQIIRGVPILVQIIYVAFVLAPALVELVNALGQALAGVLGPDNFLTQVNPRSVSMLAKVIFALGLAYGGFEAETFRAGIQSIERGQVEAARSLGMSTWQALRLVVLPQAVRRILPPLGNDFIAMLKDSSLVSTVGVRDITQQAKLYASATFQYRETYSTLAFIYLSLTLMLSLVVKWLEQHMAQGEADD
jgi:polar amino acid transport system permease protein